MKQMQFLTQSLIAHRGLYNKEKGIPENSILAFNKALEKNYPIELDVHLTKDKQVVVFHDDNLARMTGREEKLCECTYQELKELRLEKTNETIPLLQEVLELVQGKVGLLIELKYDTKLGELESKVAKQLENYSENVAIQSFQPLTLLWFKKQRKDWIRGQLIAGKKEEKVKSWVQTYLAANPVTDPDFISCEVEMLPNSKIEQLRKNKIILGWTVKTKQESETYFPYCDNLIAENFL